MPASHQRITSVPPGEAPLWVREKWVGLSLPLAQRKAQARSLFTSGVLSGPRGFFASIGALLAGKLQRDRKSTRLNSSHSQISYAVFCLKTKKNTPRSHSSPPRRYISSRSPLLTATLIRLILHSRPTFRPFPRYPSCAQRLYAPPATAVT